MKKLFFLLLVACLTAFSMMSFVNSDLMDSELDHSCDAGQRICAASTARPHR